MILWKTSRATPLFAAVTVTATFIIAVVIWQKPQNSNVDESRIIGVNIKPSLLRASDSDNPATDSPVLHKGPQVYSSPPKEPQNLLTPTLHKAIRLPGTNIHKQALKGSVFDKRGVRANLTSDISTELVYSFSPASEKLFSSKIVDPKHEQIVLANSPAMIWYKDRFVVVMRMWLDKEETKDKTENIFSDNYFYQRTFSDTMEPLDASGRVMGIPTKVSSDVGDGPIEPRAFPFYNKVYLSFNTAVSINKKLVDTTMFWDWEEDRFVMPEIVDGQPQLANKRVIPRDKHWSPYSVQDELYMVYSLDPLRIMKCDKDGKCRFTQNAAPVGYEFDDTHDCLRGGTPTVQYSDYYYLSVAHTTLFRKDHKWKRYYTINLVVLKVGSPVHQIVYLSEPINVDPAIMSRVPIIRKEWIEDPFLFPVSLLMESEDSVIIGGHINDHSSYLFRLRGLKLLMDKVINRSGESQESEGPAPGFLHQLSRDFATSQSGLEFRDRLK